MTIWVFYHYPCIDGAFSALAAHLFFQSTKYEDVQFVAHSTTAKEKEVEAHLAAFKKDDSLLLLDYSGSPGFISKACQRLQKVTLVDHHFSAYVEIQEMENNNTIPDNLQSVIRMNKSGATLAWDHLFGWKNDIVEDHERSEEIRQVFLLVEDSDLWAFGLKESKAFNKGMFLRKMEYDLQKNPGLFSELLEVTKPVVLQEVIKAGQEFLEKLEEKMGEVLQEKFKVEITDGTETYEAYGVMNSDPALRSDLGNELAALAKKKNLVPIGAIFYPIDEGTTGMSLRSIGENVDVSKICKHYGGGGHINAASCKISTNEFEKMKVKAK